MVSTEDTVVGKRISFGPDTGTVRYHGPVAPSKGDWLGIEWDDSSRGRHDGTGPNGVRYFHVRVAGSASFVRPTSPRLSYGCSFLEALQSKYADPQVQAFVPVASEDDAKYSRKNLAEIEIQMPNMQGVIQRAARLDRLREVGLGKSRAHEDADDGEDASLQVSQAFDVGEGEGSIRKICPNLRWLDLSRSLLADWHEVSLIAAELDKLQTLLLHFTRLSLPTGPVPHCWNDRFASVTDLRLDGTLVAWADIVRLSPAFRTLQNLQLGSNQINKLGSDFEHEADLLPSLTTLSLEDNLLQSWVDLANALSRLPALKSLNLTGNGIEKIPAATDTSPKFSSLNEIYFVDNALDSWDSLKNAESWIDDGSKGLERLHIATVETVDPALTPQPFLAKYEYRDFRACAIAHLAHLCVLDHTAISPKERNDAELFIHSHFKANDPLIILGRNSCHEGPLHLTWQEKLLNMPRLADLAKKFDSSEPQTKMTETQAAAEEQQLKTKDTLRSKIINLTIHKSPTPPSSSAPHLDAACLHDAKELQILASTPFRLAKLKLAKAASTKPSRIESVWVMLRENNLIAEEAKMKEKGGNDSGNGEGASRIVFEIDDLSRDLQWYNVGQGDAIVLVTADED